MKRAREAARARDCDAVANIEAKVLALPKNDDPEGSFHDSLFLRDVEIRSCLVDGRLAHGLPQ
jgi:hypothetical protein